MRGKTSASTNSANIKKPLPLTTRLKRLGFYLKYGIDFALVISLVMRYLIDS